MTKPTTPILPHALPLGSQAELDAVRATIQESERSPALWRLLCLRTIH